MRAHQIVSTTILIGTGAWLLMWGQDLLRAENGLPPGESLSELSSMRVVGQLIKIEGRYYVIKDRDGKELYLVVGSETELTGSFQPGDTIEAWTSPVEHAMAIRALNPDHDNGQVNAASRFIAGSLLRVEEGYYVLLDAHGKEVRVLVNQDTELAGEFQPGDQVEVFTSPIEHALAIRSAK